MIYVRPTILALIALAILLSGCATVPPDMAEYRRANNIDSPVDQVLKALFGDIENYQSTSVRVNGQTYIVGTTTYRGGGGSVTVNRARF